MDYLPIFFDIREKPCLVVGGGEVAARKCALLLRAGARVTVVAPTLGPSLDAQRAALAIVHRAGRFALHDADGFALVIAATDDDAVNREVAAAAHSAHIPVNVVDLGLIYLCEAEPLADGTHRIDIEMSMTAPGCGMGDVLKEDARTAVQSVPGVSAVNIELVWDPPWDQERMSDAARLQLGMF